MLMGDTQKQMQTARESTQDCPAAQGEEKQNPEKLLREGTVIQFSPAGYSMYPLFVPEKRDQAIVEPLGERRLRKGMVVLYRRDGEKGTFDGQGFERGILVLHRICRLEGEDIYTVGDNQYIPEGPLRREQICGVLTGRVRDGKTLCCSNLFYRFSAWLWLALLPVRPVIYGITKRLRGAAK